MKRLSVLIGVALLLLALPAGLALAGGNAIDCSANPRPECPGTGGSDDFEGEDVPDGNAGARDFITGGSGLDAADGNSGDDVLLGGRGTDGVENGDWDGDENGDYVDGGDGADGEVEGENGQDTVLGGPGDDYEVEGGPGNDVVRGGEGNDGTGTIGDSDSPSFVRGGSGDNLVHGNEGADDINARLSNDGDRERIFGDAGNDEIFADDGERDHINCGRGDNDFVEFDPGVDELNGCEDRNPVP
jgi:hypothetical protein